MLLKFIAAGMTILTFAFQSANAVQLSDYSPFGYEVLFTNPICKQYSYRTPVESQNGDLLYSKTKNAYCKSSDSNKNAWRKNSPHYRLIQWIKSPKTKEIFMAYLSFSKKSIAKEICNAIKKRNVKFTLIMDRRNEEDDSRMATANFLKRCHPQNVSSEEANYPVVRTSGHRGGAGYAHNKVTIINPNSKSEIKIGFSSGNMSSGTVTHHENWHFVTTHADSYFAQVHLCLMDGVLKAGDSKSGYTRFISQCRREIKTPEESDIKVFFIPGEGTKAFNAIKTETRRSNLVEMAAHRFSYGKLISLLTDTLRKSNTEVKLVVDDDVYWTGVYRRGMGRNSTGEQRKIRALEKAGMEVKYIETYANDVFEPTSMQLQHNKFLIFTHKNGGGSVFAGAGNLTSSAFNTNFENFYLISIPSVFKAFKKQYSHFWLNLADSWDDMPTELKLP